MDIGENMRSIRERLRLSRNKVEDMTGINYNYIGQIERGEKNPTIDILLKLANAYDVTVSELIGEVVPYSSKFAMLLKKYRFANKYQILNLLNTLEKLDSEEIEYLAKFINKVKK